MMLDFLTNLNPHYNIHYLVKKQMFKNTFSYKGRIRRTEYALSIIIYYGATFIIGFILGYLGITDGATYGLGVLYLSIIPVMYWAIVQAIKRAHDRSASGWWILVPFYGLWLLFGDSVVGENEYGANPKGIN